MTQLEMENRKQEKLSCLKIKKKNNIKKLCEFNILPGVIAFRDSKSAGAKEKRRQPRRHSLTQNKPDALLNSQSAIPG